MTDDSFLLPIIDFSTGTSTLKEVIFTYFIKFNT